MFNVKIKKNSLTETSVSQNVKKFVPSERIKKACDLFIKLLSTGKIKKGKVNENN